MKIIEIISMSEDLQAGGGNVTVGNAGSESIILHQPTPMRHMKKPPQVGYGIKVGKTIIPTPGYNSDNDRGQVNKVVG